jgi:hypothetical protein
VRTNETVPLDSPAGKHLVSAGLYQSLQKAANVNLEDYRDVQTAINEPLGTLDGE